MKAPFLEISRQKQIPIFLNLEFLLNKLLKLDIFLTQIKILWFFDDTFMEILVSKYGNLNIFK